MAGLLEDIGKGGLSGLKELMAGASDDALSFIRKGGVLGGAVPRQVNLSEAIYQALLNALDAPQVLHSQSPMTSLLQEQGQLYTPQTFMGGVARTGALNLPLLAGRPSGLAARAKTALGATLGSETLGKAAETLTPSLEAPARMLGGYLGATGAGRLANRQLEKTAEIKPLEELTPKGRGQIQGIFESPSGGRYRPQIEKRVQGDAKKFLAEIKNFLNRTLKESTPKNDVRTKMLSSDQEISFQPFRELVLNKIEDIQKKPLGFTHSSELVSRSKFLQDFLQKIPQKASPAFIETLRTELSDNWANPAAKALYRPFVEAADNIFRGYKTSLVRGNIKRQAAAALDQLKAIEAKSTGGKRTSPAQQAGEFSRWLEQAKIKEGAISEPTLEAFKGDKSIKKYLGFLNRAEEQSGKIAKFPTQEIVEESLGRASIGDDVKKFSEAIKSATFPTVKKGMSVAGSLFFEDPLRSKFIKGGQATPFVGGAEADFIRMPQRLGMAAYQGYPELRRDNRSTPPSSFGIDKGTNPAEQEVFTSYTYTPSKEEAEFDAQIGIGAIQNSPEGQKTTQEEMSAEEFDKMIGLR